MSLKGYHEHRCHRGDAAWADPRQVCTCKECRGSEAFLDALGSVRAEGLEPEEWVIEALMSGESTDSVIARIKTKYGDCE